MGDGLVVRWRVTVVVGEPAASEVHSLSVVLCLTNISNRNDMNYQQQVKPACEAQSLFGVVFICCY